MSGALLAVYIFHVDLRICTHSCMGASEGTGEDGLYATIYCSTICFPSTSSSYRVGKLSEPSHF